MNKNKWYLIIFAISLVCFAVFSTKIGFHDAYEYITVSKSLAGIENLKVFSAHSIVYPFIISIFLKIWPSLIMIKLINVFWLFLIGAILLLWLKNKSAFLIFAFSPLIWYTSIQITPILPASLFLLLAFIFFKKEYIKYNQIYSGFFLGLSVAVYTPMILISGFFILIYLWDQKFSKTIKYMLAFCLAVFIRLLIDYYFFNNPFYSFIRYVGANIVVIAGLHPETRNFQILNNIEVLSIIFIISPFLFKFYKLNFKEYKKEIVFLILSGIVFLLRGAQIKYFLIITPIIAVLLSKMVTKKEIKWNSIISIGLIIIITFGFFGATKDYLIKKEINKIIEEFEVDYIIAGGYEANKLSTFLWKDSPEIVWFMDYNASLNNKTTMKGYSLNINSKIPLRERLEISANFNRFEMRGYEDYLLVTEYEADKSFKLIKCYKVLCVYEKLSD